MTFVVLCALVGVIVVHSQDHEQHDVVALFKAHTDRMKEFVLATGTDITSPSSMISRPKSAQASGSQLRVATTDFIHCGGSSDCSISYSSPLTYVPGVEVFETRSGILSSEVYSSPFCTGSNPRSFTYRLGQCSSGSIPDYGMKVSGIYWTFNNATNVEEIAGANYSHYNNSACSGAPYQVYFSAFQTNPSCVSYNDFSHRSSYFTTWRSYTNSLSSSGVLTKIYTGKWTCRLGGPLGVDTAYASFELTNECSSNLKITCDARWPGLQQLSYSYFNDTNPCTNPQTVPYYTYSENRKYCQRNGGVFLYTYCKPY